RRQLRDAALVAERLLGKRGAGAAAPEQRLGRRGLVEQDREPVLRASGRQLGRQLGALGRAGAIGRHQELGAVGAREHRLVAGWAPTCSSCGWWKRSTWRRRWASSWAPRSPGARSPSIPR